eukprot:8604265-Pyramimonas_sp.AAC.1
MDEGGEARGGRDAAGETIWQRLRALLVTMVERTNSWGFARQQQLPLGTGGSLPMRHLQPQSDRRKSKKGVATATVLGTVECSASDGPRKTPLGLQQVIQSRKHKVLSGAQMRRPTVGEKQVAVKRSTAHGKSTVQYSTVQYSAVQYRTVQYRTVRTVQ